MSSNATLTIKRRPGTNRCYNEMLPGDIPLRMLQIPAGSFLMGSPKEELDRENNEGPQHQVTLSPFFMAKYPVTQAQWRAVAGLPEVSQSLALEPSQFEGDLNPVEQVSWHDAVEFCNRLTQYSDRQYRLPSEAEWEYACRAGTTTPFHFGETLSTDIANYRGTDNKEHGWSGSYGEGPKGEYSERTTPVNRFEGANAFGLHDMHGNVWEWCQDDWHDSYNGAPEDGAAWVTGGDEKYKILRGGAWNDYPRICRSASRCDDFPGNRYYDIGFRVVCSAPRTLH